jgi:hypothetical protein
VYKGAAKVKGIEAFLVEPVRGIEILSFLPEDAQGIANVYKVKEEDAAFAIPQMRDTIKHLPSGSRNFSTKSENGTAASALLAAVNADNDKTLIIAAHNDNGILQFPDGSHIAVDDVNSLMEKHSRKGLVLSCATLKSAQAGVNGVFSSRILEWNEITRACSDASKAINNAGIITYADLLHVLEKGIQAPDRDRKEFLTLVVSSAGTVTASAGGALLIVTISKSSTS